jgi:hypothetical protein
MNNKFQYYYNNVPGKGLCRNNLIYTSLISQDQKTFCQWYHNDTEYHRGQNQVVDPDLMEEKWSREIKFLNLMNSNFPDHIPKILDIDLKNKKIYLEIDGPDMWEQNGCTGVDYSKILPDWDRQMLDIIKAHKTLGIYKISMHPSSYFIVDEKLKSINYFFCYDNTDKPVNMKSVLSHISKERQQDLLLKMKNMKLTFDSILTFVQFQNIAFETFKNNFLENVMEEAKLIYDV